MEAVDSQSNVPSSPVEKAKFYGQNQPIYEEPKKSMKVKNVILGFVVALLIIGGFWFVVVRKLSTRLLDPAGDGVIFDTGAPKNDMNPLTGEMFSEQRSESWKETRPMAIMINNAVPARPQSGLNDADLIYEIVAEGGITRYLAFYLTNAPEKIGPVRSTREYYLVLVKELGDAMIMHIGWSPQALTAIETWPVRSLARGGATFWRDQDRLNSGIATEHTAYVDGKYLRELSEDLGWDGKREFTTWVFKDDNPILSRIEHEDPCGAAVASCTPLEIDFWFEGDYSGIFKYDSDTNSYLRFIGYDANGNPVPQNDEETNEQLSVKNVIVQFVEETAIAGDDKNRLDYDLTGSGTGLVFLDGEVKEVTWSKEGRDDRTMFYDQDGNEVEFNRGKIWISVVPDRNTEQVTY